MTSPRLNIGQRLGDMALWLFFCAISAAILSHA